jgi:two-component system phosphate regulon response regulator PhoB
MSDLPASKRPRNEPTLVVDDEAYSVYVCSKAVQLRVAEFDLLSYLVAMQPRVLGHAEIARAVFDTTAGDTSLLVRVHMCNLRRALGKAGCLIETVRGRGYRVAGVARSRLTAMPFG